MKEENKDIEVNSMVIKELIVNTENQD